MVSVEKFIVAISLMLMVCAILHAQDDSDKINSNIGGAVSFPLSPTSHTVNTSWGLVGGAGYNISKHHSVIGEFFWSALYPSSAALQPLRIASNDNTITGHSNLYTMTGNYRYEWQRRGLGVYFIGGGGWYFRTIGLAKAVTSGQNIPCSPAWKWWGFSCTSGMVIPNQTRGSYDSSVIGGNAGVGFTIRFAEPNYRVYIEPRYHYAPTANIQTHLLEVTLGIRY